MEFPGLPVQDALCVFENPRSFPNLYSKSEVCDAGVL